MMALGLVNFNLDVDLRCNLNSILKALLHWHVDCWCGRAFCSYVYGRICEGRFCGLIHCGGGRASTPPVPGLEEFREGSSKLAEKC